MYSLPNHWGSVGKDVSLQAVRPQPLVDHDHLQVHAGENVSLHVVTQNVPWLRVEHALRDESQWYLEPC